MRPENAQQAHRRTLMPGRDLIEATLELCWDRIPARAPPPQIQCTPPEHPPEQHLWMAAAEKKKESYKQKIYLSKLESPELIVLGISLISISINVVCVSIILVIHFFDASIA